MWFPHSRILQRDLCEINELVMGVLEPLFTHAATDPIASFQETRPGF